MTNSDGSSRNCGGPIAGKPAPTGECIPNVGAGLPAMRPLQALETTRRRRSCSYPAPGSRNACTCR
ncbi:hypothetical protein C7A10_09445 [Pseudomonas fluorescens]|uniref:Uncharacterized protein n=1 Tax=Pseudomonas fluorescens TaxID=294 RepID=A0A2T0IDJ0_PSEFL|nr:hypothetical protein C1751_13925 [Pseudomonas fluorescens]PRW93383.1 hypothetical protein C7A10_09445 [Pseudomonas fluorescens]